MAFKDTFNKMISYFDTDEVNEVEEDVAASTDNVIPRSQQSVRASSHPKQEPRNNHVQQDHQARSQEQTRSQMQPFHGLLLAETADNSVQKYHVLDAFVTLSVLGISLDDLVVRDCF